MNRKLHAWLKKKEKRKKELSLSLSNVFSFVYLSLGCVFLKQSNIEKHNIQGWYMGCHRDLSNICLFRDFENKTHNPQNKYFSWSNKGY